MISQSCNKKLWQLAGFNMAINIILRTLGSRTQITKYMAMTLLATKLLLAKLMKFKE